MKNLLLLSIAFCISTISFGQLHVDYGEGFDFKPADEKEPKLVLADNYNTYLLSYINIDGMFSEHEIIIRKFDQKNQLVNTYKQTFPKIDNGTLYNYVGSAEMPGNNKVVVFTESYSSKADKQDLYQHVFDKATGKYTTTLVKSFLMESVMRKGDLELKLSENKRYIGIINKKNSSKKEPAQNTVLMLDASTLSVTWSKDVPLESKNYERAFTVTNSGKAVLTRAATGFKLYNFLTIVAADKVENKELGEEVELQDPKAVSIGNQDYLIGFDYDAKGLRAGNFEKFMLYDIDAGKMVYNNKIAVLNKINDVHKVAIRNVFIQNNEFHIFVEAELKAGTRSVKTNAFSTMAFDEPYYKWGPAYIIIMDMEGKIKSVVNLSVDANPIADTYSSFGLVNVKGDYRILGSGSNIYKLSANNNFERNEKETITFIVYDGSLESSQWGNWKVVPHLLGYINDSKKFIAGRYDNNKLSLVTVSGF